MQSSSPPSAVGVAMAALAEDNSAAVGAHSAGRLSLRFSVARRGWQQLLKNVVLCLFSQLIAMYL